MGKFGLKLITEIPAIKSANFSDGAKKLAVGTKQIKDRFVKKYNIVYFLQNNSVAKTSPNGYALSRKGDEIILKPTYVILHLESFEKGQGKEAIKEVVLKSLCNSESQGRVMLMAETIDGKNSPAGFYYKLGFRFENEECNKTMQNWIKKGGSKASAPQISGSMYLPLENIPHCLNY